jgi:hypothetical protein
MIRGFQILQICNFWMCRTKGMNLLMWQMSLNQFENEFKMTTETDKGIDNRARQLSTPEAR